MNPFAKRQFSSALLPVLAIGANTLTSGSTVNTYDAGQVTTGIDSWNSGRLLPRRILVLINVGAVSGSGTLTVTLRDSASAITTANGNADTALVATLATIDEPGLHYAEIDLNHIFPSASETTNFIKRYHSIRAVAASCNFTFSIDVIYGFNDKLKPVQSASSLAVTYND